MRYAGYIYGDWKQVPDAQHPYHKIACILLDVKSVMQNYVASGARKMFKYGRLYSGVEPVFIEDDVFRIIQPLNENYSFDAEIANGCDGQKTTQKILDAIMNNPNVTRLELSEICGISADGVKWQLKNLTKSGHISRIGGDRGGRWEVYDK